MPKNTEPSIIKRQDIRIKSKIREKTERTVILENETMIAEITTKNEKV